jgi:hypothetical protein
MPWYRVVILSKAKDLLGGLQDPSVATLPQDEGFYYVSQWDVGGPPSTARW